MGERIELPQQLSGDEQNQLKQLWSYLYQMAENLNIHLDAIGGNELTDDERKIVQAITQPDGETPAYSYSEMETLKSLIIKTAEFVQTKVAEWRTTLLGESVAEGKFGRYVRQTGLDVVVNPEGITQNYSFSEIIQGLKVYEINAKNYIKSGLLRTVNGVPVYGVAIGKDIVTFSEDGVETYNDGNKVAELTADELSFWQGGYKVASYKGNKISFLQGGNEVFYVQSGKIYCVQDLEIASGKKLIINATNFAIDANGNVTVKGTIEIPNGKTMTVKSGGDLKIESGGDMKIESGGDLKIESGGVLDVDTNNFKLSSANNIMQTGGWKLSDSGIEGKTGSGLTESYFRFKFINMTDAIIERETASTGTFARLFLATGVRSYGTGQYNEQSMIHYGSSKNGLIGNSQYPIGEVWAENVVYWDLHQQSSRNLKKNIKQIKSTGEIIDQLRPVSYQYKNDKENKKRFGLIWEETVEVLPEICVGKAEDQDEIKGVQYIELIPILLKEIQDLRKRVAELERR